MSTREEKIAEDAPFDVPVFDDKEFIRKELVSFRTTLVLFIFSIAVSGLTYALWRYGVLGAQFQFVPYFLIAMALGAIVLRFLFRAVRIDISHWKRREWFGTFVLYFFFWLGFFLLFVNPPLTDATAPVVELRASPAVQSIGNPIHLGAYIADNTGVDAGTLAFCIHAVPEGAASPNSYADLSADEQTACRTPWTRTSAPAFWNYTWVPTTNGTHRVFVVAADGRHQIGEANATLLVGDPFSTVAPPRQNVFEHPDDAFSVRVQEAVRANVLAVQYSLDDGTTFQNLRVDPDAERAAEGWWKTDPSYQGWSNDAHDVVLRVVEQPHYLRHREARVPGGIAVDPDGPYTVTVAANLDGVGQKESPSYAERAFFDPSQTPGVGIPVLLALLGGVAIVGRRTRDA